MASTRLIKRRIKSAKNIAQITKAMQMVAASKMKKAQNLAVSGKPYADKIYQAVYELSLRTDPRFHPLLKRGNLSSKSLVILVSTNKGLCGSLNTNLFRACWKWFPQNDKYDFITLGRKGEALVVRAKYRLLASFGQNEPFLQTVPAVIDLAINEYLVDHYQEVILVYNNFLSVLRYEPVRKNILPLGIVSDQSSLTEMNFSEFVVEPSYDSILDALLPHYLENQLREAIIEAEASEHSARMMAMKNATDSALDLLKDLTLVFNRIRQEKITYEIADIVTARLAVE